MKMMTGVIPKETMEISEILASDLYGQMISVNGAVHTVRDMGEVAFVVLRKREGLLQCVYEEGVTAIDLKELKEGAAIEVSGVLNKEERAPGGFEIRMKEVKILSEPAESLPLPIAKWKMNTSLEARLNHRAVALRNIRERATFRIQEGIVRGFRDFLFTARDLQRSIHQNLVQKVLRAVPTCLNWSISTDPRSYSRVRSFTNR